MDLGPRPLPSPPDAALGLQEVPRSGPAPEVEDFAVHPVPELPPELRDHPRYRIVCKVGEGGMGAVYKAEHRLMGRPVALKVINRDLVLDDLAVARFQHEVWAAARLTHPNIVTAYDAEQVGNNHLLVMEFVEGINLARLVDARGPLPVGLACDYLRQAARGLEHAHAQGMVHRDVKPHNLMVSRNGQVKILDFGLARLAHEQGRREGAARALTLAGEVLGTPDYLAPEQARDSKTVDARADLYALGCTAYFLLSGRVPFPGETAIEKLLHHWEKEPLPVEQLRPEVPRELAEVVRKLMAKKPDARYQTAGAAGAALAPFASVPAGAPAAPWCSILPRDTPTLVVAAPPRPLPAPAPPRPAPPAADHPGRAAPSRWRALFRTVVPLVLGVLVAAGYAAARHGGLGWFGRDKGGPAGDAPGQGAGPAAGRPNVLFLLASRDSSFAEYDSLRRALQEGGVAVVTASSSADAVRFEGGAGNVKPNLLVGAARPSDFDALVIGGGPGVREYTGGGEEAKAARWVIGEIMRAGKPVAAIGTGPSVLSDAFLLRGKRVTCADSVRDKVERDGALLVADALASVEPAVGHGPILTGRDAAAGAALGRALRGSLPRR